MDMPEILIQFQPLPWPPSEQCACGNTAAWEMILLEDKVLLCSECYQIETLRQSSSRGSLLGDRIHRHWLIYRTENPVHIRSDGIA
jgi:hypothetical protein